MQPDPGIFKAYDIRGTVPSTLSAATAHALGRAFARRAREMGEHAIAVGRDGRLSSPQLAEALVAGLASAGAEVIDLGMVTTPAASIASIRRAARL